MEVVRFTSAKFRRTAIICCLLMLMASAARAANGRISFSGAIVTPTCALAVYGVKRVLRARADASRVTCDAGKGTRKDVTGIYSLHVTTLSGAMVDPRVRTYFGAFADTRHMPLAVRTYR